MAFFCTANGSSPGRCGKSFDLILSGVTKGNQLEVLSKKIFEKKSLLVEKVSSKILKITNSSYSFRVIIVSNACHVHRAHR